MWRAVKVEPSSLPPAHFQRNARGGAWSARGGGRGADDATAFAFQQALAARWATTTADRTTQDAGEPGVRLRCYLTCARNSPDLPWSGLWSGSSGHAKVRVVVGRASLRASVRAAAGPVEAASVTGARQAAEQLWSGLFAYGRTHGRGCDHPVDHGMPVPAPPEVAVRQEAALARALTSWSRFIFDRPEISSLVARSASIHRVTTGRHEGRERRSAL
ncbi:DUF6207 family protein [Streptomyces sp. NPDC004393]